MALAPKPRVRRAEPMIGLINVVFLLLVFFLVSASLAPPLDRDVRLVQAADLAGRAPPDAAVLTADGRLSYRGAEIAPAAYVAARVAAGDGAAPAVRLVPDRAVEARRLIAVARALSEAGAAEVWLVTDRGLR
jgi:biopolymer transport protein ExbD